MNPDKTLDAQIVDVINYIPGEPFNRAFVCLRCDSAQYIGEAHELVERLAAFITQSNLQAVEAFGRELTRETLRHPERPGAWFRLLISAKLEELANLKGKQ